MHHSTRRATINFPAAKSKSAPQDAIALLKADHRQVEDWFDKFLHSRSTKKKIALSRSIFQGLRIHMKIEEELFYPAFIEATHDQSLHHEAEVEHAGVKHLLAQLENSGPEDEYFVAKVKVLCQMVKHHVREEERRDGMFAKAKASDMDLDLLGEQLQQRKQELQAANHSTSKH